MNGWDIRRGDECVPDEARCNRLNDCSDGSDERGCVYSCGEGLFMCATGTMSR